MQIKTIYYASYWKLGPGLQLVTSGIIRNIIELDPKDKSHVILASVDTFMFPLTLRPVSREIEESGLEIINDQAGILT
ncbi:hypothetical protein KAJ89_01245 [Candidatus Parcubacteria bacterium]|nr:hypothetical protein [Candidatus Parcubacteria bacterium]